MNLKGKRIFIIEDKPDNYIVIKLILEPYEVEVWFDRWGKHVMERLREFVPVDLILLDLMFPDGISGFDLFDQIRADPLFASVPIVAVSASTPSEVIPRVRQKGFAGFIAKPVDDDLLPGQIDRILGGQPVWYTG